MPFPKDHKYTADEFLKMTFDDSSERYELLNGEILSQAAPSTAHQRILGRLFRKIADFIDSNNGRCEAFTAPYDIKIDDNNVVQPDIAVICDPSKIDEKRSCGAPDLIIEVTSSNYGRDYVDKLEIYRRAGVREYWIVDPLYERVMVYFFEKSDFPNIYTFDSAVPVNIYDGRLTINFKDIVK